MGAPNGTIYPPLTILCAVLYMAKNITRYMFKGMAHLIQLYIDTMPEMRDSTLTGLDGEKAGG